LSNTPVILDNSILSWTERDTRTMVLEIMRPGDLHTHSYNDRHVELLNRRTGEIQPFVKEARKRGVLFDLGHGGGSFVWPVAVGAMKNGFPRTPSAPIFTPVASWALNRICPTA